MPNATNDDDELMDSDNDELVDEIIRDKVIIYIANCFPKMAGNRSNLSTPYQIISRYEVPLRIPSVIESLNSKEIGDPLL